MKTPDITHSGYRAAIVLILWITLCLASVAALRVYREPRVEIYTAHGVITKAGK